MEPAWTFRRKLKSLSQSGITFVADLITVHYKQIFVSFLVKFPVLEVYRTKSVDLHETETACCVPIFEGLYALKNVFNLSFTGPTRAKIKFA
jgi:hypothetical protein